jgi:RNA polymerase sporulation-specific sigma factor
MIKHDQKQEQQLLSLAAVGDKKAISEIVRIYQTDVRSIANDRLRRTRCACDVDDLIQEGNKGLLRAIETLKTVKVRHFAKYAQTFVRRAIAHYVRTTESLLGRRRWSTDESHDWLMNVLSLDELNSEIAWEPVDDRSAVTVRVNDLREFVDWMLRTLLSAREKQIISLHFGLNGDEPIPLQAIATKLAVSKQRVSKIEQRALRKLQATLRKEIHEELHDYDLGTSISWFVPAPPD